MDAYTYIYQSSYGSPVVDKTQPKIEEARVSPDGLRVDLHRLAADADGLRRTGREREEAGQQGQKKSQGKGRGPHHVLQFCSRLRAQARACASIRLIQASLQSL